MQGEVSVYPCSERSSPVLKLPLHVLHCAFHSLFSVKESMQTLNDLSVLDNGFKKRGLPLTFMLSPLFQSTCYLQLLNP